MKPALFKPSALSLAIAGVAVMPVAAWGESLLDGASDIVTLREAPSGYDIRGFDIHKLTFGRFAVVWAENNDSDTDKILLQLFGDEGQALGTPKVIAEQSEGETEAFEFPSIAADEDGNLVIAWTVRNNSSANSGSCAGGGDSIRAVSLSRPYTSSTNLILPGAFGQNPCGVEVVMDDDGDFALAWSNINGAKYDLSMQTYLAGGTPVRGKYQFVRGAEDPFTLAMQDNQALLVAWKEDDGTESLLGQRFDIQLNKVGSEFSLDNNSGDSVFHNFGITTDVESGFIAYWADSLYATSNINVQRWMADGTSGESFTQATLSESSASMGTPDMESDTDGNLIAVWDYNSFNGRLSATDSSGNAIANSHVSLLSSLTNINYPPKLSINNDRIGVSWVNNSNTELHARTFTALAEVPEEEEESTELFGSLNQPWLWLLGGLMAAWRFASRWRRPNNTA